MPGPVVRNRRPSRKLHTGAGHNSAALPRMTACMEPLAVAAVAEPGKGLVWCVQLELEDLAPAGGTDAGAHPPLADVALAFQARTDKTYASLPPQYAIN